MTRSPWANAPAYDPAAVLADIIARLYGADTDRANAIALEDMAFFDRNPGRSFHLRAAAPCERDAGFSKTWVLVVRIGPDGYLRFPFDAPELRFHDARNYDTEEDAGEAFDLVMQRVRKATVHPEAYAAIKTLRRKRKRKKAEVRTSRPQHSKSNQIAKAL